MIGLNKIRKGGAIFFEIISILLIAFYSSPQILASYQSNKHQSFFQYDSENPIVFYKASENLTYTHPLPKVQMTGHSIWDVVFDTPSLEIATSEALFVATSLRNVFYVLTSINAP
jgi:hypothetical protein